jgi:lipid-A-disaccharide synthase-like uncharacterized protein
VQIILFSVPCAPGVFSIRLSLNTHSSILNTVYSLILKNSLSLFCPRFLFQHMLFYYSSNSMASRSEFSAPFWHINTLSSVVCFFGYLGTPNFVPRSEPQELAISQLYTFLSVQFLYFNLWSPVVIICTTGFNNQWRHIFTVEYYRFRMTLRATANSDHFLDQMIFLMDTPRVLFAAGAESVHTVTY